VRCPFCAHLEDRVVDSRTGKNGEIIRRRRECLKCQRRFTTYERVEEVLPTVVKKDGRREPFDRHKILAGIQRACQKRPVSAAAVEGIVQEIENELLELGEKEIPSSWIGQRVMDGLQRLDDVAYVRFASVYRQFKDISEFMSELKGLLDGKTPPPAPPRGARG
jgi:transcriptional repressor NrdR